MDSIFYKYLIDHGITNLIEVDGLLYASLNELIDLHSPCFVAGLCTGCITFCCVEAFPELAKALRRLISNMQHR